MMYCQDCGAANDVAGTFCRICGRGLSTERGPRVCPACSQPTANQATFCSSCGIAVMQATATQPAHNFAFAGAAADGGGSPPLNPAVQVISEGLDLPDWLKRAAAEQPQDESQATDRSFMYTGVNPTPVQPPIPAPPMQPNAQSTSLPGAQLASPVPPQSVAPPQAQVVAPQIQPSFNVPGQELTTPPPAPQQVPAPLVPATNPQEQSLWPSQVQPTVNGIASVPAQQASAATQAASNQVRKLVSPEISSGGLAQGMPSWLSQRPQTPPAPVDPPVPQAPEPSVTDTTNFISESDLPAWIRQLAEADEQRKAQEAVAAAAAAAAICQPPMPEPQPRPEDLLDENSLAQRISQHPSDEESPQIPSNPWLNRREQPDGAGIPQVDVWSRPKPSGAPRQADQEPVAAPRFSLVGSSQQEPAVVIADTESSEKSSDNNLRLALLIAAAVSVVALAAYLYMTGGL